MAGFVRAAAVSVSVQQQTQGGQERADEGRRAGSAAGAGGVGVQSQVPTAGGPGGAAVPARFVRRRSLLGDGDGTHSPEHVVALAPTPQPSEQTSSSAHLQQARASIALGHIGGSAADGRQPAQQPARRRTQGPASSGLGSWLLSRFRAAPRPKIADSLLAIQPSDLRRPSFPLTGPATAPTTKSPKPAYLASSASTTARTPVRNPRSSRFQQAFSLIPSRRMQKSLRIWVLCAFTLLIVLRLLGRAPAPTRYLPPMPRASQLLERVYGSRNPKHAAPVETGLSDRGGSATGGTDDVASGQVTSPARVAYNNEPSIKVPPAGSGRLWLSPKEVAAVRRRRAEKLWAAPEDMVTVEVEDAKKGHLHESTIIFLHGLSQVKNDAFMPANMHKRLPNTRWVVPLAPKRKVDVYDEPKTAWYNIRGWPYHPSDRDDEGMFRTARQLNRIIAQERARLIRNLRRRGGGSATSVPAGEAPDEAPEDFGTTEEREWASKRIILAGFSQGAVMTLLTGLTHPERLGGLIVYSGYLPLREEMAKLVYDLGREDLPVFWGHGTEDDYLSYNDGVLSAALLSPASIPKTAWEDGTIPSTSLFHTYPDYRLHLSDVTFRAYETMGHTFCGQELIDVLQWLERVLPKGTQRGEKIPRNLGAVEAVSRA